MSSTTLTSLPSELLRLIFFHTDYKSLISISETCTHLHNEAINDSLWRFLAHRRFRVSPHTPSSRRLRAAGSISWRTLYSNWHLQKRMPVSRHSGPTFRAFAKGGSHGALVWVTVPSADDCKLRDGVLRLTIIVQNISCASLKVCRDGIDIVTVHSLVRGRVHEWDIIGNNDCLTHDEFLLAGVEVLIPGAVFEVDALEQLVEIRVNVDGHRNGIVTATFSEKEIWEAYDLLPGGWWARVN